MRQKDRSIHHLAEGKKIGSGLSMMASMTTIHARGYADGAIWSGQKLLKAAQKKSDRMNHRRAGISRYWW